MSDPAEQTPGQAMWDALEGVDLWRDPHRQSLCLACNREVRREGLATCSPRCQDRLRRFLARRIGPRPGYLASSLTSQAVDGEPS